MQYQKNMNYKLHRTHGKYFTGEVLNLVHTSPLFLFFIFHDMRILPIVITLALGSKISEAKSRTSLVGICLLSRCPMKRYLILLALHCWRRGHLHLPEPYIATTIFY